MNASKIDQIISLLQELKAEEAPELPEEPVGSEWTLEEISMLVSGTPDLHIRNPVQFEKMRDWADPERVPFTASTWFTTAKWQKDTRPLRPIYIDGKEWYRMTPATGPDWYWIIRGVVDITEPDIWLIDPQKRIDPGTMEDRKQTVREYRGGMRTHMGNWPEWLLEAYNETH